MVANAGLLFCPRTLTQGVSMRAVGAHKLSHMYLFEGLTSGVTGQLRLSPGVVHLSFLCGYVLLPSITSDIL